jgi:hypothetical protein
MDPTAIAQMGVVGVGLAVITTAIDKKRSEKPKPKAPKS